MKINNKKAFTLAEIMIVVAIIGLVAAIAIPNFVKAREAAQRNGCIANLKQIQNAIQVWALDQNKSSTDSVSLDVLVPDYLKKTPVCPKGGVYTLTTVDSDPTCNIAGHNL